MRTLRIFVYVLIVALAGIFLSAAKPATESDSSAKLGSGPVLIISINGAINPATDEFLKTSIDKAVKSDARLLVVQLNTPGGLLTSMQTMVESLLSSPVPTAVYVSPSGAGATSAGVFITLAGNFAVMAPGTTIGAAHPVSAGGDDMAGDMRAKVENFAVSLIKAISEQRGRNVEWAELAVRESVSITDSEALEKKVIDFIASDLERLLSELEGRTAKVKGGSVTLVGLSNAPRQVVDMTWRQKLINVLCDPNIAIFLGLAALLGIGIELYHPGGFLPGIVGVICLVLSLTAAQVLPINYGGVGLLALGAIFFIVELFMPTFGIWGAAGTLCFVLGSIYVIDTDSVWGPGSIEVDMVGVGTFAAIVGILFLILTFLVLKTAKSKVSTGQEGLVGKLAKVRTDFANEKGVVRGKVFVMGEIWSAELRSSTEEVLPRNGEEVKVTGMAEGLTLLVERI